MYSPINAQVSTNTSLKTHESQLRIIYVFLGGVHQSTALTSLSVLYTIEQQQYSSAVVAKSAMLCFSQKQSTEYSWVLCGPQYSCIY